MKPCNQGNLVGVSLSEPHTSVIAFAKVYVCLPAVIDRNFEVGAFKIFFSKIELMHSESQLVKPERLFLECLPGVDTTEVEVHMAT